MIGERLRQFREASRVPRAADHDLARGLLAPPLLDLFRAQSARDIVHSAATARWLIERGHDDPDLLVAALLHDIGKGEQRRWDRVGYVLAQEARVAGLVGAGNSRLAFRRAVARSLSHAEASAERMANAGASARAVELTRLHHGPAGEEALLPLLQEADAAN